jgi:hypothetical protein
MERRVFPGTVPGQFSLLYMFMGTALLQAQLTCAPLKQ